MAMHFVDLKAQHDSLQPELGDAIARVISESSFIRGGDVEAFEANFARLIGVNRCISCANGTDALYIALRALGAGPGDEVITTAHSWISTSETITQTGARVVFCDTELDYFCIDPAAIESKITPRTKGIVVVHLYGQSVDMARVVEIAKRHGLWLIEDSAQAHLAEFGGRNIGTFGDVATFSFYPGKNLGAMGDAGCVVTNREDIANFASLFARHGGKNDHVMEGICSRMDGLQAAILNVKMKRLVGWNEIRRRLAAQYTEQLAGVGDIVTPPTRPNSVHVFHLYVVRTKKRDALRDFLLARGIPTVINYPRALPFYNAYSYLGHSPVDFPVAYQHAQEILSLPLHPFLTQDELILVVGSVREFYQQ